ncbi:MAG: type I DNA topoisomerase [Victivallales bacterium]|nr:type I DNA topoisomerase [Victivallales bacterium]
MSNSLVIVESPTKARTIGRFLGQGITVMASQGHVRDLPERALGVDIANDFHPDYEMTANGKRIIRQLKQEAASANDIYLATDPDREGEAIAWHLQEVLKGGRAAFHRITFHEITQSAIQRSFANPGNVDMNMVDAQQARRVLDRIVGYQVSPMLWRNIQKGTSAGRVQTVALRLVVEREREIQDFKPTEYWNMDAIFGVGANTTLKARLSRVNGSKVLVGSGPDAERLGTALQSSGVVHKISSVSNNPRKKNAPPPFITSTLQQAAGSSMRFSASQTMKIAQELYEGINLGAAGQVGLITYMRTDSVNIAKEAQDEARAYIAANYGRDFVPEKPNIYRSRKSAQEAHEAIRPTSMQYAPDAIAQYLTPQQLKIYRLIWNRFIASQMAPARQMDHVIEVESTGGQLLTTSASGLVNDKDAANATGVVCLFRAAARETLFPGYLQVYNIKDVGEEDDPDEQLKTLPNLPVGQLCALLQLLKEQCFTQPPPRYTEASLVKALEQNGVGRPSTYATTVNTIQERDYVSKDKNGLAPTDLGFRTCDYLVQQMPSLFDIGFTADMENQLDAVEEGKENWVQMLKDFYEKFQTWTGMKSVDTAGEAGDAVRNLAACFKPGFKFDPPSGAGRWRIDDARFIQSIQENIKNGKPLSERQWSALLKMSAKYARTNPEILAVAKQNGLEEELNRIIEELKQNAANEEKQKVNTALNDLLDAMRGLEFNAPVTRGGRIFSDARFFTSLDARVASGKPLTDAQLAALIKVAERYAGKIPNLPQLATALGYNVQIETPNEAPEQQAAVTEEKNAIASQAGQLLAMAEKITNWRAPSTKGKRVFDDHEFVDSLKSQFQQKGTLSDKQLAALRRVMANYKSSVEGLEAVLEDVGEVHEDYGVCPKCGKPLVRRYMRRSGQNSVFLGCSGYPACRFTKDLQKK